MLFFLFVCHVKFRELKTVERLLYTFSMSIFAYKILRIDKESILALISMRRFCIDLAGGYILTDRPVSHPALLPTRFVPSEACIPRAAQLLVAKARRIGSRHHIETTRRVELVPQSIYCFAIEGEVRISSFCANQKTRRLKFPHYFSPKIAYETFQDLIITMLTGDHMYRFLPHLVNMIPNPPEAAKFFDVFGHVALFGGSGSGKTYFARWLSEKIRPVVVVDIMGEFGQPSFKLELSIANMPRDVFLYAFDVAASIMTRNERGANWTPIQVAYLETKLQGRTFEEAVEEIAREVGRRDPTPDIVLKKLLNLCASFDGTKCELYEPLKRTFDVEQFVKSIIAGERVVIDATLTNVDVSKRDFVRTFLVHALFALLNKTKLPTFTYFILDEAAKFITGNDVISTIIRAGRHYNIGFILATQSPDDLDERIRDIVHTLVFFSIHAREELYGIRPEVLRKLPRGYGIAVARPHGMMLVHV